MRRTFIAGNWKMNLLHAEGVALANSLNAEAGSFGNVEVAVCPPLVHLAAVRDVVKGGPIALGAQNLYHETGGAFTGEVSGAMLRDVGCQYVIVGHSERRQIMGESNADVNRKAIATLAAGLIPIVCVGETLEERESSKTSDVVSSQTLGSLAGIPVEQVAKIVLAYEPVWAIGTGKVATPEQAEEVHADLRRLLTNRYNAEIASKIRIQYGGSVKPDNAAELLRKPNIDGALVGGAALKADSFLGIIRGANAS